MIELATIFFLGIGLGIIGRRLATNSYQRQHRPVLLALAALLLASFLLTAVIAPSSAPVILSAWLAVAAIAGVIIITQERPSGIDT